MGEKLKKKGFILSLLILNCSLYLQRRETLENSKYRLESLAVYRRIIKIVVIMHQLMSGGILEN